MDKTQRLFRQEYYKWRLGKDRDEEILDTEIDLWFENHFIEQLPENPIQHAFDASCNILLPLDTVMSCILEEMQETQHA